MNIGIVWIFGLYAVHMLDIHTKIDDPVMSMWMQIYIREKSTMKISLMSIWYPNGLYTQVQSIQAGFSRFYKVHNTVPNPFPPAFSLSLSFLIT